MKKTTQFLAAIFALCLMITGHSFSQGIAINSTGNSADNSAMLDVSSTSKGTLITRMTSTDRNAILSPAEGLMIFNTSSKCLEMFVNNSWNIVSCPAACSPPAAPAANASSAPGCTNFTANWSASTGATAYFIDVSTGSGFTNFVGGYCNLNVGNVTSYIVTGLSVASTYYYRLRAATACASGYSNTITASTNSAPTAPTSGTHVPQTTQITWNWNAVSGATAYYYNTVNNFGTASNNGGSTSYVQTGLSCGTSYTLYVWAYSSCGNSASTTLNQSTSSCFSCGTATVTFTYRGSQVTYGTVSGQNGTCWLDRNLGASQVATSSTDAASYGDMFQWGRLDDGHQARTSSLTSTHSSGDVPGHSNFIGYMFMPAPYDWRVPQNDNLWQGVSGINNPCPAGWRLPVDNELSNEMNSWSPINSAGAFSNPLKWTVGGMRDSNGTLFWVGSTGGYRSSTISGTSAGYMNINSGNAYMTSYGRAVAMSIRCIKN